tara:strand:+ start:144 stop:383 length:240 start_codon:yes stop_codon:yes gene_type:complete
MNKLIIMVGMLSSLNCQQDGTRVDIIEKASWNYLIGNIQDMKEWMVQDLNNGKIDSAYAEYYINYLDESEDLAIYLNTK